MSPFTKDSHLYESDLPNQKCVIRKTLNNTSDFLCQRKKILPRLKGSLTHIG